MEEKAIQLLEKLATQLGVTVEYLWSILIKQAYIAGIFNATLAGIVFALVILTVIWIISCTKPRLLEDGKKKSKYEEWNYDDLAGIIMIAQGIILTVGLTVFIYLLNSAFTALFNPEYWALNKILQTIS